MAAVAQELPAFEPHMKAPLTFSVVFHLMIVIVAVVGLPYIKPELPPIVDTSITVELVDAEDVIEDKKPEERPVRKPPKNESKTPPKPVVPQVTAKKPPKPTAPAPPEAVEEFAPPQKDAPSPIKKPEPVKAKTPPKPIKRPVLTKPEEQQEEFKSLLRNLMPTEEEPVQNTQQRTGEQTSPLARFSKQMNAGELAALTQQLAQCWSVMAGARYAEDIIVEIRLFVNPDRTIRDAQIVDRLRYSTDSFFRAAADGAMRAVFRCSPLDLPPNKYDLWKTIVVTFDPRTML